MTVQESPRAFPKEILWVLYFHSGLAPSFFFASLGNLCGFLFLCALWASVVIFQPVISTGAKRSGEVWNGKKGHYGHNGKDGHDASTVTSRPDIFANTQKGMTSGFTLRPLRNRCERCVKCNTSLVLTSFPSCIFAPIAYICP
jgi:hypothetical protein